MSDGLDAKKGILVGVWQFPIAADAQHDFGCGSLRGGEFGSRSGSTQRVVKEASG